MDKYLSSCSIVGNRLRTDKKVKKKKKPQSLLSKPYYVVWAEKMCPQIVIMEPEYTECYQGRPKK